MIGYKKIRNASLRPSCGFTFAKANTDTTVMPEIMGQGGVGGAGGRLYGEINFGQAGWMKDLSILKKRVIHVLRHKSLLSFHIQLIIGIWYQKYQQLLRILV